jgi:hypothetical protein
MAMLLRGQQALPVMHLALRGGAVAATRLLETLTHSQPASQAALAPAVSHVSGQQDNAQKSSNEQADSGNVLGVLTSLLLQQQQRPQSLPPTAQQQAAAQEQPSTASAAMQWPAAAGQVIPNPSCQPDLSAASSGQVRMESQLVFDSCWRRFREKRGMVSLLAGSCVLAIDRQFLF